MFSFLASSLLNVADRDYKQLVGNRQATSYSNAEVWFKAATIAVPICGILILFILIALAIKILRSDTIDDRVLAAKLRAKHGVFSPVNLNGPSIVHQLHLPHSNEINDNAAHKKMPLLFQHNDSTNITNGCTNRSLSHGHGVNILHSCPQKEKNEANAKLNFSQNLPDLAPIVPVHDAPTNLIDLHKSTNPINNNNCNLFQKEQSLPYESNSALLSSLPTNVNSKLTYKKPLVVNWTDSDINPSNSK
uniref:BMP and activin membrane-bound inhibitor C-terminal domain-containing protein n=1 Tax=Clastoptera arizonana TaxID=38151 RepID=A0A1B6DJ73_9HEMI